MEQEIIDQKFGSSEAVNEISAALSKAQGAFTNPVKNRKVDFTTSNGRKIKYNYSDLPAIIEMSRKHLADNELSITHLTKSVQSGIILRVMLLHSSGQFFFSELEIPKIPDPQALGSILTYYRRYSICGLLNIAADEDDDGQAGKDAVTKDEPVKEQKAIKESAQKNKALLKLDSDIKTAMGFNTSEENLEALGLLKDVWKKSEPKLTPETFKIGFVLILKAIRAEKKK